MLQVARLAPSVLSEAAEGVAEFLLAQFNDDGGARDRSGRSDLYYTVFALEGLAALRKDPPRAKLEAWLAGFGDGAELDLVHRACLARCRAGSRPDPALARRLREFRADDGGFAPERGAARGTLYDTFLALGALQDIGEPDPDPAGVVRIVKGLALEDGSFANEPGIDAGTTPTTAAALTVLRHLGEPPPQRSLDWLLARAHAKGGFAAGIEAPVPDLLSTATALHALAGAHVPLGGLKEPTLDFIDSLWTGRAFCGSWLDDETDAEYAYYALLALGHLSLA
jgi:prenyltransferase beta subunit